MIDVCNSAACGGYLRNNSLGGGIVGRTASVEECELHSSSKIPPLIAGRSCGTSETPESRHDMVCEDNDCEDEKSTARASNERLVVSEALVKEFDENLFPLVTDKMRKFVCGVVKCSRVSDIQTSSLTESLVKCFNVDELLFGGTDDELIADVTSSPLDTATQPPYFNNGTTTQHNGSRDDSPHSRVPTLPPSTRISLGNQTSSGLSVKYTDLVPVRSCNKLSNQQSLLGRGTYGVVTLMKHSVNNQLYAVKSLDRSIVSQTGMHLQVGLEISVQRILDHPNIVKCHEVHESEKEVHLVLDYCSEGDLFHLLRSSPNRRFSEFETFYLFIQLISGLIHIHSAGYVHRDLKLENLLLNSEGVLKIADFGWVARINGLKRNFNFCGTLDYLSPEMIRGDGHDWRVDNWAVGVVLFEMLTGKSPFLSTRHIELLDRILSRKIHSMHAGILQDDALEAVKSFLRDDVNTRLSFADIGNLAWVRRMLRQYHSVFLRLLDFNKVFSNKRKPQEDQQNDENVHENSAPIVVENDITVPVEEPALIRVESASPSFSKPLTIQDNCDVAELASTQSTPTPVVPREEAKPEQPMTLQVAAQAKAGSKTKTKKKSSDAAPSKIAGVISRGNSPANSKVSKIVSSDDGHPPSTNAETVIVPAKKVGGKAHSLKSTGEDELTKCTPTSPPSLSPGKPPVMGSSKTAGSTKTVQPHGPKATRKKPKAGEDTTSHEQTCEAPGKPNAARSASPPLLPPTTHTRGRSSRVATRSDASLLEDSSSTSMPCAETIPSVPPNSPPNPPAGDVHLPSKVHNVPANVRLTQHRRVRSDLPKSSTSPGVSTTSLSHRKARENSSNVAPMTTASMLRPTSNSVAHASRIHHPPPQLHHHHIVSEEAIEAPSVEGGSTIDELKKEVSAPGLHDHSAITKTSAHGLIARNGGPPPRPMIQHVVVNNQTSTHGRGATEEKIKSNSMGGRLREEASSGMSTRPSSEQQQRMCDQTPSTTDNNSKSPYLLGLIPSHITRHNSPSSVNDNLIPQNKFLTSHPNQLIHPNGTQYGATSNGPLSNSRSQSTHAYAPAGTTAGWNQQQQPYFLPFQIASTDTAGNSSVLDSPVPHQQQTFSGHPHYQTLARMPQPPAATASVRNNLGAPQFVPLPMATSPLLQGRSGEAQNNNRVLFPNFN